MMFQAGIVGVFKTLLILLGVFFLLKIVGKIMMARRNIDEDKRLKAEEQRKREEQRRHKKEEGKVKVIRSKSKPSDRDYADFEIIDE